MSNGFRSAVHHRNAVDGLVINRNIDEMRQLTQSIRWNPRVHYNSYPIYAKVPGQGLEPVFIWG